MKKNIILTGLPKSGKSTLLNKVISCYKNKVGLVTNEICEYEERTGFEVETSAGEKATIASVDFSTNFRVSKYFVNLDNLEFVLPGITKFGQDDLLFIDEIGQMQLSSEKFQQLALNYLDSSNICLATLSKIFNNDFTKNVRSRKDVIIIEISDQNRDAVEDYIKALIGKILKAKRYISEPARFLVVGNKAIISTDHGSRHLENINNDPVCECDFFKGYSICSHIIALQEYLSKIEK